MLLPHQKAEKARQAVGRHDRLADIILDGRVIGDPHPDIHMLLARRLLLGDVNRARVAMPFQQDDEQSKKKGSTISSFDMTPSPTGPTMREPLGST